MKRLDGSRRLGFAFALLILGVSSFSAFLITAPAVPSAQATTSQPLTSFTAKNCLVINTPSSFFQNIPQSNITVTHCFLPLGVFYYLNSNDNASGGIISAKWDGLSSSLPLLTNNAKKNSTTWAFNFYCSPSKPLCFGHSLNMTAYFKEQFVTVGGKTYPSTQMEVVFKVWSFSGTNPLVLSLNILSVNGKNVKYDSTAYTALIGTVGFVGKDKFNHPTSFSSASSSFTFSWTCSSAPCIIDPTTIGTSSTADAADFTFSRKDWFSNTRYWKWYSDGTNLGYRSSTDAITWSAFTTITTSGLATSAFLFNTYVSGTTLYYCDGPDGGTVFYYGSYTLNSDGTITGGIAEQTVTKTKGTSIRTYCSVELNGDGKLQFAVGSDDATNKFIEVWNCSPPLSSCAPTDIKDLTVGTSAAITHPIAIILGLASGRLAVWYGDSANNVATKLITASDVNTWNAAVSTTTKLAMFHTSAINSGDTIYLTGRSNADNTILYWTCPYACASAPTEVTVESAGDSTNAPSITISSSTLIDVYSTSASTNYRTSTDSGSTWSAKTTIASSLTIPASGPGSSTGITAMSSCNGSTCAASWVENNANPFNVRVATFALSVTQPLTITMSVGVSGTWTITGCSPSPTTMTSNGSPQNIVADPSCLMTITRPADSAGVAYRLGGAMTNTSFTQTTCSSGTCTGRSVTAYELLQQTFKITANAQGTFDPSTTMNFKGTQLGTANTVICLASPNSNATDTCSTGTNKGYADYGTVVTCDSTMGGAPASTQWKVGGTSTFTQTTAQNTNNCNYYKQGSMTSSYSVADALGVCSAPVLTYTNLGTAGTTYTLTTTGTAKFIDWGSTSTVTNPLTGSTSSERCVTTFSMPAVSAGGTINPAYKHQYNITNTGALSITRTNNGTSAAVTATSFFFDATTSITVNGAIASRAWSPTVASWIYEVTISNVGIQLLGDQAISSINWRTSNANAPYLTFTTSTSCRCQGWVPPANSLSFVQVTNNGVKNTAATFTSNMVDETGVSPHEWDFSTGIAPSGGGGEGTTGTSTTGGGGGGQVCPPGYFPVPGGCQLIATTGGNQTSTTPPTGGPEAPDFTSLGITLVIVSIGGFSAIGLFTGNSSPYRQPDNHEPHRRRPRSSSPSYRQPRSSSPRYRRPKS